MKNGRKYRKQEKLQKVLSLGILSGKIINITFPVIFLVMRKYLLARASVMVSLASLLQNQVQLGNILRQTLKSGQGLQYMEM